MRFTELHGKIFKNLFEVFTNQKIVHINILISEEIDFKANKCINLKMNNPM